jgi:nucleoside 2-deoxyribosyltransferase
MDHMTRARELNVAAAQHITKKEQVSKHDIVMTLLNLLASMDALIQALADPERQHQEKVDMATVYEVGFRNGVETVYKIRNGVKTVYKK